LCFEDYAIPYGSGYVYYLPLDAELAKGLLSRATLIDAIRVGSHARDLFFIGHFYGISIKRRFGSTCVTIGIFLPSFYLLPY
jgi:hypothetical protein